VKLSKIAELSAMPVQSLATKVRRGTELSAGEARRIARTRSEHGVTISSAAQEETHADKGRAGAGAAGSAQKNRGRGSVAARGHAV
jgi:hypothetical protein